MNYIVDLETRQGAGSLMYCITRGKQYGLEGLLTLEGVIVDLVDA